MKLGELKHFKVVPELFILYEWVNVTSKKLDFNQLTEIDNIFFFLQLAIACLELKSASLGLDYDWLIEDEVNLANLVESWED